MKKNLSSNIKSILWATDFSRESRFCLPYIQLFSTTLKTKNHALYVLPKFSDWVYETAFVSDNELLGVIEKTRQKSLTKIMDTSKKSNIDFVPQVIEGRITSEEILKYAKENEIQMIFVGRRGISELEEILIGSTTSRLIRNSRIPVFVVPKGKRNVKIENILCPIDLSDFCAIELEYAISLSRQLEAKLTVIHISEFFNYKVPMLKRDKLIEKINKNIFEIADKNHYKIENIIHEIGEPAKKIIEISKKNRIDLIAMSTHQRTGIEKFFLGSISEKVLMASNLPVVILPPLVS